MLTEMMYIYRSSIPETFRSTPYSTRPQTQFGYQPKLESNQLKSIPSWSHIGLSNMRATNFLSFLLSMSSLTFGFPAIIPRACAGLSSYTITGFTTFSPSLNNTHAATVSFRLTDDAVSASTSCSATAPWDYDTPIACDNGANQFTWDGKKLSIAKYIYGCGTS